MQHRRVILFLAGLFVLGLLAMPARAQSDTAEAQKVRTMMEQRDRDIKQAIRPLINDPDGATAAQRERLEDLINGLIDFREMGRQALGPFWYDLTAEQRDEFVDVFGTIVRSQSLADLDVYNSSVTIDQVTVVGDSAYVKTTTTYQDKPTPVEYYLGRKDSSWSGHDIILDGVGTVAGYARSFQTVIRKRGFDALMRSLYKKRDQLLASR